MLTLHTTVMEKIPAAIVQSLKLTSHYYFALKIVRKQPALFKSSSSTKTASDWTLCNVIGERWPHPSNDWHKVSMNRWLMANPFNLVLGSVKTARLTVSNAS